jgi:hypothetical protein
MATNGFLEQIFFCRISVTYIGGENNDNICEANIGLYLLIAYTIDLKMLKGPYDIFVVVKFISNNWEAKHITIGLFKVINISVTIMALEL